MLGLCSIVIVLTGKHHGAAVGDLRRPIGLVGNAVNVDGAGSVGDVHAAVAGIESADHAGKFVVGGLVGGGNELGDGLCRSVVVIDSCALFEFLDVSIDHFVLDTAVTLILEILAANRHGAALLHLIFPLVFVVDGPDHHGGGAVVQVERAVGSVDGRTDLTNETISGVGISLLYELGAGNLLHLAGILGFHISALGLAVEGIDKAAALAHGLRGVALVVDDLAADDDIVIHLDVGIAARPLLVAEVEGLEHIELVGISLVVYDVECGIAVGAACLIGGGDGRDDAMDVDVVRALHIGAEALAILNCASHAERLLECAFTLFDHALLAFLDHLERCFGKADGEDDLVFAVVASVGIHRNCNELLGRRSLSRGLVEDNPIGFVIYTPLAGSEQGYGFRLFAGSGEGHGVRSDRNLGLTQICRLYACGSCKQYKCSSSQNGS